MRAVNLLPEDWRGSQRRSTSATFLREPLLVAAIGVAILVVVAVVALVLYLRFVR
jgi:hypothetical protein